MNRQALLALAQTRDRHRLQRQMKGRIEGEAAETLQQALTRSAETTRARLDDRPEITLADGLPVSARGEEIRRAVTDHQVVIVCGETGSGKTTQLPKILMQAGLGARGLIGHTQPRRLAARSVAQRIADEVGQPLGQLVGFKTRFDDQLSPASQIKLMTDGILLAETARDRYLNQYEAIIIDEAHERSLNVDFLMGYLKQLLPRRPDLKLIVTSATIDPERFSNFFDKAPILNVEGRSYPVNVLYRPPEEDVDQPEAIERAVKELWRDKPGDILVFLPGERDIRDAEQHLSRALSHGKHRNAEILPLYSRLTRKAQNKIFASSQGSRIVLSTNVAETSVTVPGIRYVIDTGLARISRYSTSSRVQRLPIEPVARASCNQRAGRCGRVAPGTCIRMFSEEDYESRPEFTDPEIRRTNLGSVLLTMADLRLGEIESFPFIDPPDRRFIRDGRNLLLQLQAMENASANKRGNTQPRITRLGRKLARLPLDPRIGRMLLAGGEHGVAEAMCVLAAGQTIQDPRERPSEARQKADEMHAPFADKKSDFISLLKLWDGYNRQKKALPGNQLRKWCREHFLNYMRLREWEDLVRQLRRIGRDIDLSFDPGQQRLAEVDYGNLHRALLTGLLDHIGQMQEKSEYQGARGRQFRIFPGSGLARQSPRWIAAGELIETSRLFAHNVASVEPEWIEQAGAHLLTREHYEPHWAKKRGHVAARERLKLFGMTIADNRKVDFGRIDPATAREIFIRDGLVPFEVTDGRGRLPECLAWNQALAEDIRNREARFRRRDLLVDETTQFNFYDEQLPADVLDRKSLLKWLKSAGESALQFDEDSLLRHAGLSLPENEYPETLRFGQMPIALDYQFEPGTDEDGVTARLPLPAISQISPERAEWLVPGLLEEKLREYLKALPKSLRKLVVPVPDFARTAAAEIDFGQGSLEAQLRQYIRNVTGETVPDDAWRDFVPSPHLRMRIAVVDDQGAVIATGRNIEKLREKLGEAARDAVQSIPDNGLEQTGLTTWPEQDLPEHVSFDHGGVTVRAIPALIDRGDSVDLKLLDDPDKAERLHRQGVIRLLRLNARKTASFLRRELDGYRDIARIRFDPPPSTALADRLVLESIQEDPANALLADLLQAVISARVSQPPRDAASYGQLAESVQAHIVEDAVRLWDKVNPALNTLLRIRRRMGKSAPLQWVHAMEDMNDQLAHLTFGGCLSHMRDPADLNRFLLAVDQRMDKLNQEDIARDRERMQQVAPFWQAYKKQAEKVAKRGERPDRLMEFRWMVEEFRVQLFAQPLGTRMTVSAKRLRAFQDEGLGG